MVKKRKHVQSSNKPEFDGMLFDSTQELSAYKKLVSEFGKENVSYEDVSFEIVAPGKNNTIVFRSWGKKLSSRGFPHDNTKRVFTPDFIVKHKGKQYIVEFKNSFRQNADYPLRRTIFLRSEEARDYAMFFECKRQSEIREAIYIIMKDET